MALKVNPVTLTLYSSPTGRYHHPLNPLNLLNPVNPHTEGVSHGEAAPLFFKICGGAATTTLGAKGPVKLKNPPAHRAGQSQEPSPLNPLNPLNLLNLHAAGVSKALFP